MISYGQNSEAEKKCQLPNQFALINFPKKLPISY